MRFYLDDVEITDAIAKQATVSNTDGGIYPNDRTKWFDLLGIINQYPPLSDNFFGKGGLHTLKIEGDAGYEFDAKIILRATYSARNS